MVQVQIWGTLSDTTMEGLSDVYMGLVFVITDDPEMKFLKTCLPKDIITSFGTPKLIQKVTYKPKIANAKTF